MNRWVKKPVSAMQNYLLSRRFRPGTGQLNVLKSATSELVANDALKLSVFITENLGLDSVAEPMELFAAAELMFFQNRNNDALAVLKSLEEAYPGMNCWMIIITSGSA